jgi:hypothetical protein
MAGSFSDASQRPSVSVDGKTRELERFKTLPMGEGRFDLLCDENWSKLNKSVQKALGLLQFV